MCGYLSLIALAGLVFNALAYLLGGPGRCGLPAPIHAEGRLGGSSGEA